MSGLCSVLIWLSRPLDYAGKQAHVELAERMKQRDAGELPRLCEVTLIALTPFLRVCSCTWRPCGLRYHQGC